MGQYGQTVRGKELESPNMRARFKRRIALLMLALLAFTQASVASYACTMDSGAMGPGMATGTDGPGADCDAPTAATKSRDANLCAVHCTWDLQAAGAAVALVGAPGNSPILSVARPRETPAARIGLYAPPSGAPPLRILLHSFLV